MNSAAAAIRELERALALHLANPGDLTELADVKWSLARALRAARRDPERSTLLAGEARASYASLGEAHAWRREVIDGWLASRAAQPQAEVAEKAP
jgi:hypothetical protein